MDYKIIVNIAGQGKIDNLDEKTACLICSNLAFDVDFKIELHMTGEKFKSFYDPKFPMVFSGMNAIPWLSEKMKYYGVK